MTPPAEVAFVTAPSDTLAVNPTGQTVKAALRASLPDQGLEDRLTLRNATADALAVRLVAKPATPGLDRALSVRVTAKGQPLWEGPLGELRGGTPETFVLQAHESTEVVVTAWIPDLVDDRIWRARKEAVQLSFATEQAS